MMSDFDEMAARFTAGVEYARNWKHNFFGAAYSTRIEAAIAHLRKVIAEAEMHPEIAVPPQTSTEGG